MKSNLEKLKEHGDSPDIMRVISASFVNFSHDSSKWKLTADFPIYRIEADTKLATDLARRHYDFAAAFYAHALHEIATVYFGDGVKKALHPAPHFGDVVGQISYSLTTGESPLSREYDLHQSIATAEKPLGDHACVVQLMVAAKKTEDEIVFVFCVSLRKAKPDYTTDRLNTELAPNNLFFVEGANLYENLQVAKKGLLIPESVIKI